MVIFGKHNSFYMYYISDSEVSCVFMLKVTRLFFSVSMNYQTPGLMMDLTIGYFMQNGGCGYVLKPAIMREEISYFSANTKGSLPGISPQTLHVKVHKFINTACKSTVDIQNTVECRIHRIRMIYRILWKCQQLLYRVWHNYLKLLRLDYFYILYFF